MNALSCIATAGTDMTLSETPVWLRVLFLQEYNTRLVVLSTSLLGVASGLVGSFLLLRKRSLLGDALSHATLPGIALVFLGAWYLGGSGRQLPLLLAGAAAAGLLGVWTVVWICRNTRIKDDTAMGLVLSVYFGAGIALLGLIQSLPGTGAAGLESFIYGKTASMVFQDFQLIIAVALLALLTSLLLFKEFRLLCFDETFAAAQGWPVKRLDFLMLVLVTLVTVAGLQAVGLILIIAFLIIPPAAARMWTHRFGLMLGLAALIGGVSGWLGASMSALFTRMPAGAVIVLTATGLFLLSLCLGTDRGLFLMAWRSWRLRKRIRRQHFLRAVYEILEQSGELQRGGDRFRQGIDAEQLFRRRSWGRSELRRIVNDAYREALVDLPESNRIRLTESGVREAARTTRNHRLWEIYLIRHADIAASHVDRDADAIEHVLGRDLVRRLEQAMPESVSMAGVSVPESPHPIRS